VRITIRFANPFLLYAKGKPLFKGKLDLAGTGTTSAPSEGGNLMSMMIEIDYAYWKLDKEDRKVLFLRHAEAMDFGAIASELQLGSEDTARMRHKRGIKKLITKIGGFKPFYDSDEVVESSTDSDGLLMRAVLSCIRTRNPLSGPPGD